MLSEKQIKVLNTITPADGFRYFSGFTEAAFTSFPLIYPVEGKKFCVVGSGHESRYDNLEDAVRAYKRFFKYLLR